MTKHLYDIFATAEKNGVDLSIGVAMLACDAKEGKQQYGPDDADYAALHQDWEALYDQHRELNRFIGRHMQELAPVFRQHDREAFAEVVGRCIKKDEGSDQESQNQAED